MITTAKVDRRGKLPARVRRLIRTVLAGVATMALGAAVLALYVCYRLFDD